MKLGIFGCGDFLRWQQEALQASTRVETKAVYDFDLTNGKGKVTIDDFNSGKYDRFLLIPAVVPDANADLMDLADNFESEPDSEVVFP